jgi:hypothetical protein
MFKTLCLVAFSAYAIGADLTKKSLKTKTKINTLITKEEVEDIKNKTWLWEPFDPSENPL